MAHMDLFNQDAFAMSTLTRAYEGTLPYKPSLLAGMGLFEFQPIEQPLFEIEMRDNTLNLIGFSDPESPPSQGTTKGEERNLRQFKTRHLSRQRPIRASEVAGIRAFGSETEMDQLARKVADRSLKLRNEAEATFEYHRLNAVQGLVKDPVSGATIYNFYTEFGITPATEINFDLGNANPAKGALKNKCAQIIHEIEDEMGGLVGTDSIQMVVLCGTTFWENLVVNKEVMDAYQAVSGAMSLDKTRNQDINEFSWGGFIWRRYRGNSTLGVSVAADKCIIFPTNVDGMFLQVASPAQDFDFVNTPGLETYFRILRDPSGRNRFVNVEIEANPMFVCTRPQALRKGRRT